MLREKEVRKLYQICCQNYREVDRYLKTLSSDNYLYNIFLHQTLIYEAQKAMLECVLEINE